MITKTSAESFDRRLRRNPSLRAVLDCWTALRLPDAWIVAGALAQSIWNQEHGRPADADIKDIDIVYFNASDLSAEGEAAEEVRIRNLFAGLGPRFDVKNEARVHLWYGRKFGREIAPYTSTADAIATFPTTATSVGVQPVGGGLAIEAPFGLDDLLGMVVRPNRALASRAVYEAKADRWRLNWPRLDIRPWE